MSLTNVSKKPGNEITVALKFLHEARLNISYQFDCNKNAVRVSLKLLCNEIRLSHKSEFTVHHEFFLAADQFVN